MNATRAAAAVAVLLLSPWVFAQRAADTVQVTIVEVPVTVADRAGNAVRDLTKEDFQLFDEGKRVPVEYFEVLDMKVVAATPQNKPLPPAATRNFLLLFDLANSSPGTIRRAGDAATAFVDTIEGRDLAAVCVFTVESGAKMITGFTNDRELLKQAIVTLGHPSYFHAADPLMISMSATQFGAKRSFDGTTSGWAGTGNAASKPGSGVSHKRGDDPAQAQIERIFDEWFDPTTRNKDAQAAADSEARNRLRVQLTSMSSIARVLDRLRGRKQIILLSEGFDGRIAQGKEDVSFKNTQNENDMAMSGEIWKVDNEQRFGSAASTRDIGEMAEIFRRSDVVLHAIDIRGLRSNVGNVTTADVAASAGRTNESLFLLSRPTGGTVFQHTNDLAASFDRMLKRQEVVYLLGFSAKSTGEAGKFHSLKVKTSAPNAQIAHRPGYYESSPYLTNIERSVTMGELLMSNTDTGDVALSISAMPMRGNDGEARIPVVVDLPGEPFFRGLDRSGTATANLFVYAFDEKNQVRDFMTQRIALDLANADAKVRTGGIRYYGTMQLPPGRYSLKAAIRIEESARIGFIRRELSVPSFESAAVVGPVVFDDAASWPMLSGPTRGYDDYPFAAGDAKYVPRGQPELKNGSDYKLGLYLYEVAIEGLGLSPVIARTDGSGARPANVTVAGRTSKDASGGMKLLLNFRPEGLQAGNYELLLTVKPQNGAESLVRMPFVLQ